MPKRVIDFDAMWGSDKLAACAEWAQAEYAWLYGLADASGCFELTNLRVIWGRVAAIRKNLTIERLEQIFDEFQDKGLLFAWKHEGKRYGYWTGSDVPGRLPPPSWRMRLERFAPPVPKRQLAEYMSKYARGRAALAGVGFREEAPFTADGESSRQVGDALRGPSQSAVRDAGSGSSALRRDTDRARTSERGLRETAAVNRDLKFETSNLKEALLPGAVHDEESHNACDASGVKDGLEAAQAQDLNWNLSWDERKGKRPAESDDAGACAGSVCTQPQIPNTNSCKFNSNSTASNKFSNRELVVQRELRVGQGPVCGPARVRPEVLERIRLRDAARAGSRSP